MRRVRRGARIVLTDGGGRFLMLHFSCDSGPLAGTAYWGLPGGGLEEGETPAQAAVRELREETGVVIADPGAPIAESSYDFRLCSGEDVLEVDTYYTVAAAPGIALSRDGFTPEETRFMRGYRWWRLPELKASSETVAPANLAAILEQAGVR